MAQTIRVLGIDIATLVFHGVGMDDSGHVGLRKRIARSAWLTCMANVPPLRIGMEACGSAHDWARCVREHGPDVRWLAPPCVKASVTSPKHDARDAEAICEAVTRPTRRVVPITRVEPQDRQARQRIRERLINARTALVNAIRGLLNASGMVLPQSMATCRASDEKLAAMGQAHREGQRRQTIPGSGPVSATARIAAIGDVPQFKNGRQLAAGLGLVPREHATGGTPRVLGMSHRGDVDRRNLWVHGARATRRGLETKHDERSQWLKALMARRGKNRAAVA